MTAAPVFAQQDPANVAIAPAQNSVIAETQQNSGFITEQKYFIDPRFPIDTPLGMALGGAAGGLALAFGIHAMARRRSNVALPYMLAGGAIALALVNPRSLEENYTEIPTDIVVVVDKTDSNLVGDRAALTAQVQERIAADMGTFENVNIRVVTADNASDLARDGGSRLFQIMQDTQGIDASNLGGIVIISDGQIHDVPEVSPFGPGVPVHTILTGKAGEIDRVVTVTGASAYGLVDEEQVIRFRVDDQGVDPAATLPVQVEVIANGEVLSTLSATPGQVIETKVKIQAPGENIFTIRAAHMEGEITNVNNDVVTSINGIREELNVLLLSGEINGSVRSVREFYKADPDSNLVHIMALRGLKDMDPTPREEMALSRIPFNEIFGPALDKYDLMVLDHFQDNGIVNDRYLRSVVSRVEAGGSLLVIAGPEYTEARSIHDTPISSILPVEEGDSVTEELYAPHLSETGFRHPITRSLSGAGTLEADPSWGDWTRAVAAEVKDEGRVIMETPDGAPLLVVSDVGEGRVAVLLSDSFPLWGRGFDGGGPANQMLSNVSHWLMKDPGMEEEALSAFDGAAGEFIVQRQTITEQKPGPVVITTPEGENITLEFEQEAAPGLWQIEYTYPENGVYAITQENGEKDLSTYIKVDSNDPQEFANVIATPDIMRPLADETGGWLSYALAADGTLTLPDMRQVSLGQLEEDGVSGADWAGFVKRDLREAVGNAQDKPVIPGWLTATLIAGMMVWGWSRDGDHAKLSQLASGLRPRRKQGGANEPGQAPEGPGMS